MRAVLSEPLVHFFLLGVLLFGIYGVVHSGSRASAPDRIEITKGDVAQIQAQWQLQWHRPPTPAELRGAIDARLREEVLAHRARELGLDRDDVVIRRRLAQKLEFVTEDLAANRSPSEAELATFFAEHSERYVIPTRVSFRQIYFSSSRRGRRAVPDAREALSRVRRDTSIAAELGDPFLPDADTHDTTLEQVSRTLGPEIAEAIGTIEVGMWHGPVTSGYGAHLLEVEARVEARTPALSEVRAQALRDWSDADRLRANERVFESLRARYQIVVHAPSLELAEAR